MRPALHIEVSHMLANKPLPLHARADPGQFARRLSTRPHT